MLAEQTAHVDPRERLDLLLRDLRSSRLRRERHTGWWAEIAAQLTHPLALLLWVASVLAAVAGIPALAAAIVAVILLNAALAFVPLQSVFGTAALGADAVLFVLPFPFLVWVADELRRARLRRRPIS